MAISEDGKYLVSGSLDSTVVCFVHARTGMHGGVVHARIDFLNPNPWILFTVKRLRSVLKFVIESCNSSGYHGSYRWFGNGVAAAIGHSCPREEV